jgi:hypothetical protein
MLDARPARQGLLGAAETRLTEARGEGPRPRGGSVRPPHEPLGPDEPTGPRTRRNLGLRRRTGALSGAAAALGPKFETQMVEHPPPVPGRAWDPNLPAADGCDATVVLHG